MKRQQGIDPAVLAALDASDKKRQGKRGVAQRQKVNVNLPANLVMAIKQEAISLTGHRRRGFSDLMAVLLQYGWEAYQAGDLELEMQAVTIEMRIVSVE